MKIAVLGGGGFRTPHVWEAMAALSRDVSVDELVLQDPIPSRLDRIAAVLEGLRRERGGGPSVRHTTSTTDAIDGADTIFCALRVGGLEGRVADEKVPLREGVLGQETVGPGGICFALRTVPVMLDIAQRVKERAPSSWFLNFTNPAGLVTEALSGILDGRVVGICDSPDALCARVAAAMGRRRRELAFDYAGLNHLGWLLAVWDGERDLLPDLLGDERSLARVEEARLFGPDRLRGLGMIPNEYLVYYERPAAIVQRFAAGGTRAEVLLAQQRPFYDATEQNPEEALASWRQARSLRHGSYMAEAWNGAPALDATAPPLLDEGPGETGYASIAAAFLRSAARDAGETLILDVSNGAGLPFLEPGAVVEVPCTVSAAGPSPVPVGALPNPQAELVARVKEVERTTIRAAVEGSRRLALEALIMHPVMTSRDAAERVLGGYLAAFPDLAERLR